MIAQTTEEEPTLWVTPNAPGRAPATTDGTASQISAARHIQLFCDFVEATLEAFLDQECLLGLIARNNAALCTLF
jgi:hypothetical protein